MFDVDMSFCPGDNAFSKHRSIADAPRRSPNTNSAVVTKDLVQSKSGKGTNIDTEEAKIEN